MEKRFEKLEEKIDNIAENVNELRTEFKVHVALIEEHVAGDKKIISELQPVLEAYKYEQIKKKENREKKEKIYKNIKIASGIATFCATIFGALYKYFLEK